LVTGENAAAELFLICSSGKAANVPKPASVGIASSQIRIAFGVRMFDEMRNFCLLRKFLPVGSSFFLRTLCVAAGGRLAFPTIFSVNRMGRCRKSALTCRRLQ
jgi:hypothetical protein